MHRIWQFGEWVDVVVDDYLPTRNGRLLYIQSADNCEFWSALLEKAYAKLYGSYEALKGGTTCEAMVDFSGGCSEIFDLNSIEIEPSQFFNMMLNNYRRSSMMACSISADPNIVEGMTVHLNLILIEKQNNLYLKKDVFFGFNYNFELF